MFGSLRFTAVLVALIFFLAGLQTAGCGKDEPAQETVAKAEKKKRKKKKRKKKRKKKKRASDHDHDHDDHHRDDDDDDEPKKKKKKRKKKKKQAPSDDDKPAATAETPKTPVAPKATGAQLTQRAEQSVSYVFFRGKPGPNASGGANKMSVRVEPNTRGEPSVGVMEEFAGGLGSQWRTATWMAAFNSSNAMGFDLTQHEFLVKAGGYVDGPSAGMMMTGTMMALLGGKRVKEHTVMTGTVNPDGSCGPVGGIPQKMAGAKAKGFKRFGYPTGLRNSRDLKTGQMVDLEQLGKQLGMETREVDDVYEAFEFLTGEKLPARVEASESDMQLGNNTVQLMKAKSMSWKSMLNQDLAMLKQRVQSVPPAIVKNLAPHFAEVDQIYARAQRYERSGMAAAAYSNYAQAAVLLRMGSHLLDFMAKIMRKDLPGVERQIQVLASVQQRLKALLIELEISAKSRTVGGTVNSVWGFGAYVIANVYADEAITRYRTAKNIIAAVKAGKMKDGQGTLKAIIEHLAFPVLYFAAADAMVKVAQEHMQLKAEQGVNIKANYKKVSAIAKAYASAASAGLGYFESLEIKGAAERANVAMVKAKNYYLEKENNYLVATMASNYARAANFIVGEGKPERHLLRLAAGATAFLAVGGLINKYYSLGAVREPGKDMILTNPRALIFQLDHARKVAKQAANEAKTKAGFVPEAARIAYQEALAQREGDDEDKLEALQGYWLSTFFSRLAVDLSRPQK